MDELLLSETGMAGESSNASPRKLFPPAKLILEKVSSMHSSSSNNGGHSRRQSTAHLITTDEILPFLATPKSSSYVNLVANLNKKRKLNRRSRSAPSVFTDIKEEYEDSLDPRPPSNSTPLIVQQAFIGVILYVIIGIGIFMVSGSFKGHTTFKPVDALYFTVVTLCTIGQEAVLLSAVDENKFNTMVQTYMIDKEKGRMRIRTKVFLALAVVFGCIAIGTVSVHFLEDMNFVDSFYLSVTSVTTVGYGDYAFTTIKGRCFAIFWLLISTLAVARAFLYLAELRIDKRNRRIAAWVLQKKVTLRDLVAADLDNDGCISKSEFIIYKLKEMGKIAEKDILQIAKQFDSLEHNNYGKITLADLMESQ
ncbi:two-pore potassium channel 3 isoform X2 [Ziziphus jujuba]|uniref:Two-pore potassium channel 3 isoform X2 n=1 Tax=Ziziphus jujuba TaxID=326968 RepID=A0A6P3ZM45_ZIZJJ|nr:two-pore potassium channel 3 isoform X2 [Ziziphus jujuba]